MDYSPKAKKALEYLFEPLNDIDIYVEDTQNHRVYLVLFKRMLPIGTSLRTVFQLPGREAVISAHEKYADKDGRKKLFIIDGDFDILLSTRNYSSYINLYQLKVFCMENLLISRNSIVEVAADCLSNSTLEETKSIINYDTFITNIALKLTPLITIYYACHLLNYNSTRIICSVNEFFNDDGNIFPLDEIKIQNKINEIKTLLLENYSLDEVEDKISIIQKALPKEPEKVIKLICGKRYLLPLAFHHLHRKVNYNSNHNTLKARLARYCNLDIDHGLQNALSRAIA